MVPSFIQFSVQQTNTNLSTKAREETILNTKVIKRTIKHTTNMFNKSGIMNNNDLITISKERILQCKFQSEEITRLLYVRLL